MVHIETASFFFLPVCFYCLVLEHSPYHAIRLILLINISRHGLPPASCALALSALHVTVAV